MDLYSLSSISTLLSYSFPSNNSFPGYGNNDDDNGIFGSSSSFFNALGMMNVNNALVGQSSFSLAASNLEEEADILETTIAGLDFETQNATSSDDDKVIATATEYTPEGEYTIDVTQLAEAQKIESSIAQTMGDVTGMANGVNQINININGTDNFVNYSIDVTDTNEEAMVKIATAINDADIGVSATVIVDTGKIQLKGEIGEDNAFSVTDVVGDAATYLGLDDAQRDVLQTAENAEFTVTLEDSTVYNYESSTNEADVFNVWGLSVELKETTGATPVTITVEENQTDVQELDSAVRSFIDSYNETIDTMDSNVYGYAQRGLDSIVSKVEGMKTQLNDVGISIDSDGKLRINEYMFDSVLEERPEELQTAITGTSGLVNKIRSGASLALEMAATSPTSLSSSLGLGLGGMVPNNLYGYNDSLTYLLGANLGVFYNNMY